MPRHLLRAAATGIVALLAGLLTAPSAQADIREFTDVGGHITYVRVTHGPATVGIFAHDDGIDSHASITSGSTPTPPTPDRNTRPRSTRAPDAPT
jgi:hypothetical protein